MKSRRLICILALALGVAFTVAAQTRINNSNPAKVERIKDASRAAVAAVAAYSTDSEPSASGQTPTHTSVAFKLPSDPVVVVADDTPTHNAKPEEWPEGKLHHFTWGADLGSSLDLTGQDLTAIDVDLSVGYKSRFVRFLGVGGSLHLMTNSGSRIIPIYAMFRSSFSSRPRLCFLQLKGGMAFGSYHDEIKRNSLFGSIGVGFTLAKGVNFSSHMLLSYEYIPIKKGAEPAAISDIHYAKISIGIAF